MISLFPYRLAGLLRLLSLSVDAVIGHPLIDWPPYWHLRGCAFLFFFIEGGNGKKSQAAVYQSYDRAFSHPTMAPLWE